MILERVVIWDYWSIALFLKFENSPHCLRTIFKKFETKLEDFSPKLPSKSIPLKICYYTNSPPANRKRQKNFTVTQKDTLPKLNQALALAKTFS